MPDRTKITEETTMTRMTRVTRTTGVISVTKMTGLLIFREKKTKISRHFLGQIRGKNGRFRGIFAGKKSKFAQKSAHFA